jgi:bla regulator protein blaR1
MLPQRLGRDVVDQTGLKGNYDFDLKWAPDQSRPEMMMGPEGGKLGADNAPPTDTSGPSLFTAVQEQLGLKLESRKGPVDILVIDQAERPTED